MSLKATNNRRMLFHSPFDFFIETGIFAASSPGSSRRSKWRSDISEVQLNMASFSEDLFDWTTRIRRSPSASTRIAKHGFCLPEY